MSSKSEGSSRNLDKKINKASLDVLYMRRICIYKTSSVRMESIQPRRALYVYQKCRQDITHRRTVAVNRGRIIDI